MLAGNRLQSLRIAVQFLLAVCQMHQRHHRKHHALISGGEIVQHLAGFLALLFQVIRHNRGEIVVAVLAALPVGHVGLHAQQAVLHLPHRFIRGHRNNVDRQHEAAVEARELVDHGVLDVAGVLLQEQHSTVFIAHNEVVLLKLHAVRTDGVLEGAALLHALTQIQLELRFFTHAVEIMEDAEALHGVQLLAAGVHVIEAGSHIIDCAVKKSTGFLDIFLMCRQSDITLLYHAVGGIGNLIQQHGVILRPSAVQKISASGNEDLLFKVAAVQALVVDGDFCSRAGIQRVQQFGIAEKHSCLIFFGCNGVVDIAESQCLGILAAKLKDPIRPESPDGDGVLYRSWYLELFFVLL